MRLGRPLPAADLSTSSAQGLVKTLLGPIVGIYDHDNAVDVQTPAGIKLEAKAVGRNVIEVLLEGAIQFKRENPDGIVSVRGGCLYCRYALFRQVEGEGDAQSAFSYLDRTVELRDPVYLLPRSPVLVGRFEFAYS
jgi:hypothetical protein